MAKDPKTALYSLLGKMFYEENLRVVKIQLQTLGITDPINTLTVDGFDRKTYLSFCRKKLLQYPDKIGEVKLDRLFSEQMNNFAFLGLSLNMGYGHLRVEQYFRNLVELLDGTYKSIFLGGDYNYLPRKIKIGFIKVPIDPNKILYVLVNHFYFNGSIEKAKRIGALDKDYKSPTNPYPEYVKIIEDIISIIIPKARNNPAEIGRIFAAVDVDSKFDIERQAKKIHLFFGEIFKEIFRYWFLETIGKNRVIISTYPLISREATFLNTDIKNKIWSVANIGTDSVMANQVNMFGKMPSFVETYEAKQKFETHSKRTEKDVIVTGGFPSPLSNFMRTALTKKRQENLKKGLPLVICALSGGIAPTQVSSFKKLINDSLNKLNKGEIKLVLQCGAEDGGGRYVYDNLLSEIKKKNMEENIILHVAKTPQAAVDFFEALSWSEMPLAFYVKGGEVSRIAYSLNIPFVPTGAIGDHEIWNILLALKKGKGYLHFLPDVATNLLSAMNETWKNDVLVKSIPGFFEESVRAVMINTVKNFEKLISKTCDYIKSGRITEVNQNSMLSILKSLITASSRPKKEPEIKGRSYQKPIQFLIRRLKLLS